MTADILTGEEKKYLFELAGKVCGVRLGERKGHWTYETRRVLVYSVLCKLYRLDFVKREK